ncbi:MAG: hypothetical protein WBP44_06120, partial [Gammaproteobacteria bacterium]
MNAAYRAIARLLCTLSGVMPAALLLSTAILFPLETRADWINLTGAETATNIAEIYVLDDRVKLVLEIYVGDLEKFEEL